ncbi:MAG: hypothetical protein UR68_C0001G0018 [Candidatus Roizmanbacteria bacterium GW2011_GWA2_35_19]|uniref:Uncharacterized protein n=2 Tax=Candidatus Roizmaniibacteriota TaxID=1752723 RepID=A0A0G0BYX5_9BACT|nr:MAG: hypothetical protein UR63_C0001G0018 [Candidatus Roizmanbacteria bacterium GW2011_GWC2_35_12]KKP74418.1 MAG: hypothetical protein UR68_C0001G0018 [Candidatus Roizmanbacteria bacterium GW2011_GWA2_35_19]
MKLDLKKITIGFVLVIIFAIIFILMLNLRNKKIETTLNSQKIKAQSKTYIKTIDLSEDADNPISLAPEAVPTQIPSQIPTLTISPTSMVKLPTPTETILAKNVSPTGNATVTSISELPDSGFIEGTIAIFAVSLSLILFAFVF